MILWKEGGRGEGEERKGYIYIKSADGPILSADVVFMRQHALLLCARSYYTCPYQCICISFQVFNSVYQLISSENDLNSNTK